MRVLYVEDDPAARTYIEAALTRRGVVVDVVASAEEGRERAQSEEYDALILDVQLPDRDGVELLRGLRAVGIDTPALFLSERGEVEDRIRGLEGGADDYLPKPFALSELLARLHAIVRRRLGEPAEALLRVCDLELDVARHQVRRAGQPIELTPKQFALLRLLLQNAGRVVSRATMLEHAWGSGVEHQSNAVDVQISYLRNKVDRGFDRKLIHTRAGLGYVLEDRGVPGDASGSPRG